MDLANLLTVSGLHCKYSLACCSVSIVALLPIVLPLSPNTIERYLQRYRQLGIQFVIHGNTGHEPVNKIPNTLKHQVQKLIREKYYDVNLLHLGELLNSNQQINVKRETLRKWAHDIHPGPG